jgi:hypothetical protein
MTLLQPNLAETLISAKEELVPPLQQTQAKGSRQAMEVQKEAAGQAEVIEG